MELPIKFNIDPEILKLLKELFANEFSAKFKGIFEIEVKDEQGNLISTSKAENLCVDQGLNRILNVMFNAATQITTWYCVMFENDYTPVPGNTYAAPGYVEFVAYNETTRPEYVEATSVAKSITNSANKAVFTANATKTLYGAALVGGGTAPATKGDTAGGGVLFCSGRFPTPQPVVNGNVINLTYTITAADAG